MNNALSGAPVNTTELTDAHLYPGATYYYKVVATYGDPPEAAESAIAAGIAGPNGQPGNLKAVSGLGFVSLSWTPIPGAVGYAVMRDDGKMLPQELVPAIGYRREWHYTFAYNLCEDKVAQEHLITGTTTVDKFEGSFLTFGSKPCDVKYLREVPGTKSYTVVPFFNVHGKLISGPNGTPPKVVATPKPPSAVQWWELAYDGRQLVVMFDRGNFGVGPHWLMRAKVADLQFQRIAVLEDSPPTAYDKSRGKGRFVDENPPAGSFAYKIVDAPSGAETDVRTAVIGQYPPPVISNLTTSLKGTGGNTGKNYDVRVTLEPVPGAEAVVVRIFKHEVYCGTAALGTFRTVMAKEVVIPGNTRTDVTFDTEPVYGVGPLEENFVWIRAEATYNWGNTPGSILKRTVTRYMRPQKDPPDWNAACGYPQ